jgi:DNA-binding beta-propeller fold protein YncE
MQNPQAIVMSPDGRTLFVTQVLARKIRQIDIASRKVTVLMDHEMYFGMAISPDGKKLLLTSSSSLSMVDIATKTSTIIAGGGAGYSDGAGTDATFTSAFGVAFDPTGDSSWALVGDGKTVRMVDLASESKTVTTIAGSLTAPKGDAVGRGDEMRINTVYGMAVSPDGLTVYISDHNNRKIKTISLCPNKVSYRRALAPRSYVVDDSLSFFGDLAGDLQSLARSIACCMPSPDRAWGLL